MCPLLRNVAASCDEGKLTLVSVNSFFCIWILGQQTQKITDSTKPFLVLILK
jgi:hypothetical protein